MEKWEIRPPLPQKLPNRSSPLICRGDYVVDPYPHAKFHQDTITPFHSPNTRKCAMGDSASFFWFFCQPTAKTPAPIFTTNTSNDVVSCKDVPFGAPKNKILHFDPIFPQKTQILANFRRDSKNFASKSH